MKTYDLISNKEDHAILSAPIPYNFNQLSYLKKLKYLPLIMKKRKAFKKQDLEPSSVVDTELAIVMPGLQTQFFRCTDITAMERFVSSAPNPVLEVNLTCEVNTLVIRVGSAMQALLNNSNTTLKIIDIYGETLTMNPIHSDIVENKALRTT